VATVANATIEELEWQINVNLWGVIYGAKAFLPVMLQQREGWDVLPCYVRGTARSASGLWRWEIRAGGTATLETPAGDIELRACTGCEAVLGHPGGRVPRP